MADIPFNLLIKVFIVVLVILIGILFALLLFGFDLMKYLGMGLIDIEDFFQPQDLSEEIDYEEYEYLAHDGMILEKDAGEDDINRILEKRVTVTDCSGCNGGCSQIPGFNQVFSCSGCNRCAGITENNRFKNCLACTDPSTPPVNCSICEDTNEDYYLCREIERCIFAYHSNPEYYDKHGCFIAEIPFNDNVPFDINRFKNILNSCGTKRLELNIGQNITRELCYFNTTPSATSFYDFDRQHDFYLDHKIEVSTPVGTAIAHSDDIALTPFYKDSGQVFEHYRIYVAVNGTPDTEYKANLFKYQDPNIFVGWVAYSCELGTIKTDSKGFGYAEFISIPSTCPNYDDWKNNPEEYPLDGVYVDKVGGVNTEELKIYVAFYANIPESNEAWTKDLRYSNCNFNTNPEPYLEKAPWWVSYPNNLTLPLVLTGGNVNSSVKVFYDSSLPGGGLNSPSRGNIKIALGRLDTDFMRNCKFDIYVCSQDAFAEYADENILTLNDFFSYFNPTNLYKKVKDGENELMIYNYFEFDLDKNYTVEEVRSAIKTGFRLWEGEPFIYTTYGTGIDWLRNDNNDGIYEDTWNEISGTFQYHQDCWDQNVYNRMNSNDERSLIHNCPEDICGEKLKVRVAYKKYEGPNDDHPWKSPLYPTITFCSSTLPCGDGDLDIGEDCDIGWDKNPGTADDIDGACPGVCQIDCTCPTMYEWRCSDWETIDYGSDNHSAVFTSPDCDGNVPYPVSCTSESAFPRESSDRGKYGEDDILEMTIENKYCLVRSRDGNVGVNEQKRQVCVLCSNKEPQIVFGITDKSLGWAIINKTGWLISTAGLPPWRGNISVESRECPAGTHPVSCLADVDPSEYGDDDLLTDLYLENGKCKATFRNVYGESGFTLTLGTVCSDEYGFNIRWTGYIEKNDKVVEMFKSPDCPSGHFPVSVFSKSDHSHQDLYLEDQLQSTFLSGDHFNITADDTGKKPWWCFWCDDTEQKRKVGILCAPNPTGVCFDTDGTDKTTLGSCTDESGFYLESCIDGTHVVEYTCSGDSCVSLVNTDCPSSHPNCVNGRCVSDGGGGGGGGGCLIEGTKLLTPNGFKKIEDIRVGDILIGYENGKRVETEVTAETSHFGFWDIYYYNGNWFTETHKVYPSKEGEAVVVSLLSDVKKQYVGTVYDIETTTHNYFGENGSLIHNFFLK